MWLFLGYVIFFFIIFNRTARRLLANLFFWFCWCHKSIWQLACSMWLGGLSMAAAMYGTKLLTQHSTLKFERLLKLWGEKQSRLARGWVLWLDNLEGNAYNSWSHVWMQFGPIFLGGSGMNKHTTGLYRWNRLNETSWSWLILNWQSSF